MKLSEYIKNLEKALKEFGDREVIYAIDDEGNGYQKVYFSPSFGFVEGIEENNRFDDFINSDEDLEEYGIKKEDFNAICIN